MALKFGNDLLSELENAAQSVSETAVEDFVEKLQRAPRIYCDGLGRSGLCARGFAMRLMHLGLTSYMVGETVTPAIQQNDLLCICSGSGESKALIAHAQKAKACGAVLAVITSRADSTLGQLADVCMVIAAPNKEAEHAASIMPMGSLFEGASALLFENVVLLLMEKLGETGESMFTRHANLE